MPGQIVSRGKGKWLVRVALGRDANGTRKYHNKTIYGTKKEAAQYLTRVLRDLDTGTVVQTSPKLLHDFMREYLDGPAKHRVSPRTWKDYDGLATRHILPTLGHRRLNQITPAEIQAMYGDLLAKGLSARTVRYAHSVLHGALEISVRWGLLARNPAKLVDLPREKRAPMRSLSRDDALRFVDAMRGTRWEGLWLLLITTGLRPGEALGLKWSDIDGTRINVQRALVQREGGKHVIAEPKTARARRVVTLPQSVVTALALLAERQASERETAGSRWHDLDLVFADSTGKPLDYRTTVRRYFRPVMMKLGLADVRPYDLRHTCATLLLRAGENVKVVSERLGHASASLTLDVYSHVLPDMQHAAAEHMEAILFHTDPLHDEVQLARRISA